MSIRRPSKQTHVPGADKVRRRPSGLAPIAAGLLLLAAVDAGAGEDPYYVGVGETVSHDSNLFRLGGNGQNASETSYRSSLVGGVDQWFGRQELHADAHVSDTRYSHNNELNNVSYGLASLLNWETVDRITGVLGVTINRGLADFAQTTLTPQQQLQQSRERNISTTQSYLARISKGLLARWSVDGGVTHRSQRYSASAYSASALDIDGADVGLNYQQSSLLTLGASAAYSRGRYPNFVAVQGGDVTPDVFTRRDLSLRAIYEVSGLTTANVRIGYTTQNNSLAPQLDISGLTGAAGIRYAPGGRFSYTAEVTRDAGTSLLTGGGLGSFAPPPLVANPQPPTLPGAPSNPTPANSFSTDNSRITTTGRLGVTYAVSERIAANASLVRTSRSLAGQAAAGVGSDTSNSASLSLSYMPQRYLSFGCGLFISSRSTSSTLSSSYSDRVESCSVQLTLR